MEKLRLIGKPAKMGQLPAVRIGLPAEEAEQGENKNRVNWLKRPCGSN